MKLIPQTKGYAADEAGNIYALDRLITVNRQGTTFERQYKLRQLKPQKQIQRGEADFYLIYNVRGKSEYGHRLIAETFLNLDITSNLVVDHIDGDKTNNALSNLRIVTQKENLNFAKQNKTTK